MYVFVDFSTDISTIRAYTNNYIWEIVNIDSSNWFGMSSKCTQLLMQLVMTEHGYYIVDDMEQE